MATGDKELEPLLGETVKPRRIAQIFLVLDALGGFGLSFLIGALLDVAGLAVKTGFAAQEGHLLLLSGALIAASIAYALVERNAHVFREKRTARSAGDYRAKLLENFLHRSSQKMQFHQEHSTGAGSTASSSRAVGYLSAKTMHGRRIPIFHFIVLLAFGAGMMLFVSPALERRRRWPADPRARPG